jgi:hypothetical protein
MVRGGLESGTFDDPPAPQGAVIMAPESTFTGEESARFTSFAMTALDCGVELRAHAEGREPLTARPVTVVGVVSDYKLDGYVRYVIVKESGSSKEYWIAGSNSTRSIATKSITYTYSTSDLERMQQYGKAHHRFVPRVSVDDQDANPLLREIDKWTDQKDDRAAIPYLIGQLGNADDSVATYAALSLRAFASLINSDGGLRSNAEREIIAALGKAKCRDAEVALEEDLGYIGSEDSVPVLSAYLAVPDLDYQIYWAAVIALGRLPGDVVVDSLLKGLKLKNEWAQAAVVLGLARRATPETQARLEPIFASIIQLPSADRLKRYACLGLSRFEAPSVAALQELIHLLGDTAVRLDVRGYAALALSSCVKALPDDFRARVRTSLEGILREPRSSTTEPEQVWSLEFLAELSMLLELHASAAAFHGQLSGEFTGWQKAYYSAMALYDEAEEAIGNNRPDEATALFREALRRLPSPGPSSPDAEEAVSFRREVIRARFNLQSVITDWREAVDPERIMQVSDSLRDVGQIYRRYTLISSLAKGATQLAERELQYLRDTTNLVGVLSQIARLEAGSRSGASRVEELLARVDSIMDSLRRLSTGFVGGSTTTLRKLVKDLMDRVDAIQAALAHAGTNDIAKIRRTNELLLDIKDKVAQATWPLPARAFPITGLGKGRLTLIIGDLPGAGTDRDPILFPSGGPTILNVLVEILEMAPGGSTTAVLACSAAGEEHSYPIPVPEGPYTTTVRLGDVVSPYTSSKCVFELVFRSRECSQIAYQLTAWLRRKSGMQ